MNVPQKWFFLVKNLQDIFILIIFAEKREYESCV